MICASLRTWGLDYWHFQPKARFCGLWWSGLWGDQFLFYLLFHLQSIYQTNPVQQLLSGIFESCRFFVCLNFGSLVYDRNLGRGLITNRTSSRLAAAAISGAGCCTGMVGGPTGMAPSFFWCFFPLKWVLYPLKVPLPQPFFSTFFAKLKAC